MDPMSWDLVVNCEGENVPVRCVWVEGGEMSVEVGGEEVTLSTDWVLGDPMMEADIGGKEVLIQV